MSVVSWPSPGRSLRRSSQYTPTVPSPPTARLGRNACDATFATAAGLDQLLPPSIDFENRTCDEVCEAMTFQATYAVPSGAMSSDASLYARTSAPVSGSCGADGGWMLATLTAFDQLRPPFVERWAITSQGVRGTLGGRNAVAFAST